MDILRFHWKEYHEIEEIVYGITIFGIRICWSNTLSEKWKTNKTSKLKYLKNDKRS